MPPAAEGHKILSSLVFATYCPSSINQRITSMQTWLTDSFHLEKANLRYQLALAEIATLLERSTDCVNEQSFFQVFSVTNPAHRKHNL